MENITTDLRWALDQIKRDPNLFVETDVEVDPYLEVASVYRKVGAGGSVIRPTKVNGPAMMFNKVKGFPGTRMVIGVLGSRKRMGLFLNSPPDRLGFQLCGCVDNPLPPVFVPKGQAPCQEVVHSADDPDFDIRKILPVIQTTANDPSPCITMGLCRAVDPETGKSDVTIHRMFVQDLKDEITILADPKVGRHIGFMIEKAEKLGKPLPITVSIGLDPAIYMSSCFAPPATPFGFDELSIAGALRGQPVELAECLTIDGAGIAHAEYVIEGEVVLGRKEREDKLTESGNGLAEFPGYTGIAHRASVIKIKAITHRKDPIYQTCLGPGEEHVNMAGIPTEACIINLMEKALPGRVKNVYAHSSGGGKFMAIIQVSKEVPAHEGLQRQAALTAFTAFYELKHVILVDDDVDPFDTSDVMWALNTRYQGNIDTVFIPGIYAHHADPSAWPEYSPFSRTPGNSCKTIFDCTVPFDMRHKFERAHFEDVDVKKFLPDFED